MLRWTQQLGVSVVLVALAASAWSQTAHYTVPAATVGDDFAVYHQAVTVQLIRLWPMSCERQQRAVRLLKSQPRVQPHRMRRRCTSSLRNLGTATMKRSVAPSRE